MTKEELAMRLNGREYGSEIHKVEEAMAKSAGLLVIFGASDDLVELRGAINEEVGAYDGATVLISVDGKILKDIEREDEDVLESYDVLEIVKEKRKKAAKIKAVWSNSEPPWTFETDLPHATFEVMEGEEKFCKGIVIDMKDVDAVFKASGVKAEPFVIVGDPEPLVLKIGVDVKDPDKPKGEKG
jgi:hypothetical protein